jgi:hypothetical protein
MKRSYFLSSLSKARKNGFIIRVNPDYALELRHEGLNGNKISTFVIEP